MADVLSFQDLSMLPDRSPASEPAPTRHPSQPLSFDDLQALPDHQTPMDWSDVGEQAVSNLGPSLYHAGAAMVQPFLHPIDTAQSLYDIGKGAVSKAEGALGFEQDPAEKAKAETSINAVRDYFVDRYGSMEGFKKALATDPAGVGLDLSTAITGPASLAVRAPGVAGKLGSVAKAVDVADTLTNPVLAIGKGATKVVEPIVSTVLGHTTGVGKDTVRTAARAGFEGNKSFLGNMRGEVPMAETVDMAKDALGKMRQSRSDAYRTGMDAVKANSGNPMYLGYRDLHDALTKATNEVYFNGFPKSQAAAKALTDIQELISNWRGAPPTGMTTAGAPILSQYSVEGFDALKQAIGEVMKTHEPGTLEHRIAKNVYDAAKNSITARVPEYAKVMSDYSNASDKLSELERTFSLGHNATTDAALRKLQSVTRNNATSNYGHRADLLNDNLTTYQPDLPFALAGQAMSSSAPRGLAQIGAHIVGSGGLGGGILAHNPLVALGSLAALPAYSPRGVGEAAYAAGKGLSGLKRIPGATEIELRPFSAATRGAYQVGNTAEQGVGVRPQYDDAGNLVYHAQ